MDAAALLDELPDIVVVVDADAAVLWVNRAGEEQLGWRSADVRGRSGIELVHPDDIASAAAALQSVQDKHLGSVVELRVRAATGAYRSVELRGRSAIDVDGIHGIVLVMRDITDRRGWEVAAGNESLLQAIVDHAPTVTMLLAEDGVIRGASRALTRLLGRDLEFTVGRPFAELALDADRKIVASEVLLAAHHPGQRAFEARFPSVSGPAAVPMSITIVNLLDDDAVRGLLVTATDITPLAEARAELHHLATHDVLTGLPNRALLRDRLAHAIAGARRRGTTVGVVYVDIDRFKEINDELGHRHGDDVLVEIARRLAAITRTSDTVARVGGDEFVVVLEDADYDGIETYRRRVAEVMALPVEVGGEARPVGVSAGGVACRGSDAVIDELLARADEAMYRAKAGRRSGDGAG